MIFKPVLEVDFQASLGSQVKWIDQGYLDNYFFILQICKNNIILVKSLQKKKSIDFNKI
jgi:hypothetical protein